MTIAKALKKKNKLTKQLSKELEILTSFNSVVVGSEVEYNLEEVYSRYKKLRSELVDLKTAILKASVPIYPKIFEISELKGSIEGLRRLTTTNGMKLIEYSNSTPVEYKAFLTKKGVNEEISRLEDLIEDHQSTIDEFNHITKIN